MCYSINIFNIRNVNKWNIGTLILLIQLLQQLYAAIDRLILFDRVLLTFRITLMYVVLRFFFMSKTLFFIFENCESYTSLTYTERFVIFFFFA